MKARLVLSGAALFAAASVHAAGFALYGASAKGMAMGGAVVGQAPDASANFYNPATLSDLTNTVITLGLGMEVPRAHTNVRGGQGVQTDLNPGCFYLPHAYIAQPLPWGFTFGLGLAPEFGLGSAYNDSWALNWNTMKTTVEGFVVNPNLAYAITDDWSVSAGFRLLYFSFVQDSSPYAAMDLSKYGINKTVKVGQASTHIKSDNKFSDFGWTVSTRYKILDNLSFGLMYRSEIDTHVRGKYQTCVRNYDYDAAPALAKAGLAAKGITPSHPYYNALYPTALETAKQGIRDGVNAGVAKQHGLGAADITLPQSIIAGLNWDPIKTVHLGTTVTWTHWSSMDAINFKLQGGNKDVPLQWEDVFRFGFGAAWDFAENWTLMGSYVYDIDPCSVQKNIGSTMLPAGDRHALALGLAFHWRGLEFAATYGYIIMSSRTQVYQPYDEASGRYYGDESIFETSAGRSHQLGFTVSYFF